MDEVKSVLRDTNFIYAQLSLLEVSSEERIMEHKGKEYVGEYSLIL